MQQPSGSLCTTYERGRHEQTRQQRLKREGSDTPAMRAHDMEHAWRMAGEQAIREEMERRVATYRIAKTES